MRKEDFLVIAILIVLIGGLLLPFVVGPLALFPFHSHAVEPWSGEAPTWVKDEAKNVNVGDKHSILYPDLLFSRDQFRQGHAPLWNPHNFAGLPHQAVPLSGASYPFTGLAILMDPVTAIAVIMAIHLLLAAVFTYAYLRGIGLSVFAAVAGALCWAFSGWNAVHLHHAYFVYTMTWLPLALFAIERVLYARSRWALMLLSFAIGFMILAGFPQTAMVNLYFIAAYAVVGLLRLTFQRGAEVGLRRSRFLLGFAVLGLLLAAVQLLPTLDYMPDAGHQNRDAAYLRADSLRPVSLIQLVIPDFFGNPQENLRPQEDFFALWLLADGRPDGGFPNNYSERSFFVGVLALLLACAAPLLRRDRVSLTLWLAALISILLATGSQLLDLATLLPGMNFGSPMRYTQIAAFAFPCLFAISLHVLFRDRRQRQENHRARKPVLIGSAILVGTLTVVVATMWSAERYGVEIFTTVLQQAGADVVVGTKDLPLAEQQALALEPFRDLRFRLSTFLGFLGCGLMLLVGILGHARKSWLLALGIILLGLVELGWHFERFNRPVRRQDLYQATKGIDFLRRNLGDARFIRFGKADTFSFFLPNTGMIYGLNDAQGFRALAPKSYLEFMRTVEPNPADVGLPNLDNPQSLTSPQLDLLRVRYVISKKAIPACPLPQVYPSTNIGTHVDMYIYENTDCLKRVQVVHEVKVRPDADTGAEFMKLKTATTARPFDGVVWLEQLKPGMRSDYPEPNGEEKVLIAEDRPGRIAVELKIEKPGILVLSEQFSAGWTARVFASKSDQGRRIEVLKANLCFMAVPIRPEDERIEFHYEPNSFKWGGLISGLTLIFLTLVPLIGFLATPQVVVRNIAADGSVVSHKERVKEDD